MRLASLDVRGPNMFGEKHDALIRAILGITATDADRAFEDDFIAGCYALATARAQILRGGTVYPIDAEFVFSLWCRWPLKPDVSEEFHEAVDSLRQSIFGDGLDPEQLAAAVPDSTLLLPSEGLFQLQAAEAFDELFPPAQSARARAGA